MTSESFAQANSCTDPCCVTSTTAKKSKVKDTPGLTCKLTNAEFRKRKEQVLKVLKTKILARRELKAGFQFTFNGSDSTFAEIADFIKSERTCCNFLIFDLKVADSESNITLEITGPRGTKDFIRDEMNL